MLDDMRKPIFIVALVVILLAVLAELGSMAVVGSPTAAATQVGLSATRWAIPALPLLDGLLFFATLIIGVALFIPDRVQSKVQGIVTLLFSLFLLLICIRVFFVNLALLFVMVPLVLSVPFGTLIYLAIWGHFDTSGDAVALSLIMTLKIVFCVCLVLAHQRFLQNKGLVLIIITSLVANLIIGFLHAIVPGILVSITDNVASLVVVVLAAIWAVVYLIGGVVSVVKVIV